MRTNAHTYDRINGFRYIENIKGAHKCKRGNYKYFRKRMSPLYWIKIISVLATSGDKAFCPIRLRASFYLIYVSRGTQVKEEQGKMVMKNKVRYN